MKEKKVLVSGIQPSGDLHIGNYFGAIKQMVDLVNSDEYESYIFVADYHSMTTLKDKKDRKKNILNTVATYLACGLDKDKVNIFKQSDLQAVTELAWILNTVTPISMLELAHSYKDKKSDDYFKKEDLNAGIFNYPVLMAADILIHNADIVPVGKDQSQHLEYAREIAGKYNRAYGVDTFKSPRAYIKEEVNTIRGTDGEKMSKSRNNHICMFLDDDKVKQKVMSIKTDSKLPNERKDPDENNIYNIYKLFLNQTENRILRNKFLNSDRDPYSYKNAKENLFYTIIDYFSNMKGKYDYYTKTREGKKELRLVLKEGKKKVNKETKKIMKRVRLETGLDF